MAYEMEKIKLSQSIFYYLLCNSSLIEKDEPELYRAYVEDEDVMNLVKSQGEISDCVIERYGTVIYIMPNMGNEFLGFTKNELKKSLCKANATDKDYYLSQFIVLTLLAEFYDGQGNKCKSRDFIKMGELQNIVSERIAEGLKNEIEHMDEELPKLGLDFQSMSEAFESLKSADKATSRTKTTKEGIMNSIMDFLEKQGLIIYIQEDEMIKTSDKLDNIMEMRLLNKSNYEAVMAILGVKTDE